MIEATEKKDVKVKMFRKRPNKGDILKQAKLRGHMTYNEETMLKGLTVKNSLQRIYTKTFDDSINKTDCETLKKAMDEFNTVVQKAMNEFNTVVQSVLTK